MTSSLMTSPEQLDDALAGKLKRTELQHGASSIPGHEIVQVFTEIPCGTEPGWHIHRARRSATSSPGRYR